MELAAGPNHSPDGSAKANHFFAISDFNGLAVDLHLTSP
jgi:hypothetical protein